MPRVLVPINTITPAGLTDPSPVTGDAANDHYLATNNGRVWLRAKNTSLGSLDITVKTNVTLPDGLVLGDRVVTVAAGATKWIGGLKTSEYNQNDGTVHIDITSNSWELTAFVLTTT